MHAHSYSQWLDVCDSASARLSDQVPVKDGLCPTSCEVVRQSYPTCKVVAICLKNSLHGSFSARSWGLPVCAKSETQTFVKGLRLPCSDIIVHPISTSDRRLSWLAASTRFYQLKVSFAMVCVLLAVVTANHGKRHFELIEPRILHARGRGGNEMLRQVVQSTGWRWTVSERTTFFNWEPELSLSTHAFRCVATASCRPQTHTRASRELNLLLQNRCFGFDAPEKGPIRSNENLVLCCTTHFLPPSGGRARHLADTRAGRDRCDCRVAHVWLPLSGIHPCRLLRQQRVLRPRAQGEPAGQPGVRQGAFHKRAHTHARTHTHTHTHTHTSTHTHTHTKART